MSFSSNIPGLQNQLDVSVDLPHDLEGLRDAVNDFYQGLANNINSKEGALFVPVEKLTSGQYFITSNPQNFRAVYRMVVDFGALPNTGTKTVAHNIVGWTTNFRGVRSYGYANDLILKKGLPIPNEGILLEEDETNIIITTSVNYSAYTDTTIVLEFTKAV